MKQGSVGLSQCWSFPGAVVIDNCILREMGSVIFFFFEVLMYSETLRTKTVADLYRFK